jgi:hypothetical protein
MSQIGNSARWNVSFTVGHLYENIHKDITLNGYILGARPMPEDLYDAFF